MIVLLAWLLVYALSITALIFGIQRLRLAREQKKQLSIDEISVIIPFRNESERLPEFLKCIHAQRYQPVQWIFVNDHSEDDWRSCFKGYESFPIRVLNLPEDQRGKKRAIRYGIDHATTDYVVTMDADVTFGKEYMKEMLIMPEAQMVILPVEMTAKSWWQQFFALEYLFTSLINKGAAGWFRPVNCSGANLLLEVKSFDEVDDIEEHDQILSGDDMYTLRAFRQAKKRVEIIESEALTVYTATPNTFSEVMEQRTRWVNKTGNVKDNFNSFLGIWAVLLHLFYFFLLIVTFFGNEAWVTLILIVIKGGIDMALLAMRKKKWTPELLLGLVLFECFYPFYLFALLGSVMFSQPEWKGR